MRASGEASRRAGRGWGRARDAGIRRGGTSSRGPRSTSDRYDGRGADPERFVGVLDLDANREPRGQTHPVDRLLHARKPHHARAVVREDGPSETDDGALKTM